MTSSYALSYAHSQDAVAASMTASITVGIDPLINVGPFTIAWHGLTIAIGILVGGLVVAREARARRLHIEPVEVMGLILIAGAIVGSKVFYLAEHGALGDPGAWFDSRGFTFYGGFIAAAGGLALYVWRRRLSIEYLDAIALGLPLGYGIGRVGDVINGEHYGAATTFFLGVRNSHPDADVPSHDIAYHSGGLYEMLIGLTTFAVALALHRRLCSRPTAMVWLVIALLGAGRFFEFFARSDSAGSVLGLDTAQWTSLVLILIAAAGAWLTSRSGVRRAPAPHPSGSRAPRREAPPSSST
jgi:phosphatidylglycerol:prolipoprotein diacylglycerol transferase